jgi:hypothetical protein
MLYADKAALENRTKLRLLAIRERELTLYTQNCFTIGTVSALMAGLAYSSLLYTKMDYFQDATAFVQAMYVMGNVISMYLALRAMTGTTMIAMFGPGKVRIACDGPAPCPSPLRAPEPRFTQKRRAGRRCAAPTVRCTRRWTPCLRSLRRPAPPSIAFQSLAKAWPYSSPLPHPHHSPLTTHHSPLITHHSPLTTQSSILPPPSPPPGGHLLPRLPLLFRLLPPRLRMERNKGRQHRTLRAVALRNGDLHRVLHGSSHQRGGDHIPPLQHPSRLRGLLQQEGGCGWRQWCPRPCRLCPGRGPGRGPGDRPARRHVDTRRRAPSSCAGGRASSSEQGRKARGESRRYPCAHGGPRPRAAARHRREACRAAAARGGGARAGRRAQGCRQGGGPNKAEGWQMVHTPQR